MKGAFGSAAEPRRAVVPVNRDGGRALIGWLPHSIERGASKTLIFQSGTPSTPPDYLGVPKKYRNFKAVPPVPSVPPHFG